MVLRILPTLIALISFILFLLHRRRFVGTTGWVIRQVWAILPFAWTVPLLLMRLPLWLKGDPKDIVLLWIIIPCFVTSFSMMYLNGKDRREFVDKKSARLQMITGLVFLFLLFVGVLSIMCFEVFVGNNPQWRPYFSIIFVILLIIVSVCIVILFDAAHRVISQKFKKKN